MTLPYFWFLAVTALPIAAAAAPVSLATPGQIKSMIIRRDHGLSLDKFVKRHADQRQVLISDFRNAGFDYEHRKNGCDYLSGGVAHGNPGSGWAVLVWLCRDTSGASSRWGVSL
jgi:hypothetical protein